MRLLKRSRANSRFRFLASSLGLALALSAGAGCGRPSKADCGKAVDHLLDLIQAAAPPESADVKKELAQSYQQQRTQFLQNCQEQGTKKDVECILKAKTLDDLQKTCGQAATGK